MKTHTHGVPRYAVHSCLHRHVWPSAGGRVGSRRILSFPYAASTLYLVTSPGPLLSTCQIAVASSSPSLYGCMYLSLVAYCTITVPGSFSKRTHHALLSTFFAAPLSPLTLAARCPRLSCSRHRPWSTPRIMPVAIHKTSPTISTASLPIQVAPVLQSSRLHRTLSVRSKGWLHFHLLLSSAPASSSPSLLGY